MTEIIDVIYENGILRPLRPLNLRNGERLKIRIVSRNNISNTTFGVLKASVKEINEALGELEDEWGVH